MKNVKKKEIIILTTKLGNDGAERILSELSNQWVKDGHKVSVIQTGENGNDNTYSLDHRVNCINTKICNKNKLFWYFKNVKAITKILNKNQNAIAFLSRSIYMLTICSLFTKNKIILSERNDPTKWPQGFLRKKMRDLCFCFADSCVFQTQKAMSHFPNIVQKKGIIIYNPCNPNLPSKVIGPRRKVIISVGRLHKQKNFVMLIKAFAKLSKEYPEYILEIYGQGEEETRLKNLIYELNLENRVFLPGFTKNIYTKMVDSTMYICSSDYEGISNAMLEALGMGVPTISTDCPAGGAKEMINNGVNGLLVPVGDSDSMYIAMKKIIDEPQFAEMISSNACIIKQKLNIEKISKQWIEVM